MRLVYSRTLGFFCTRTIAGGQPGRAASSLKIHCLNLGGQGRWNARARLYSW